MAHVLEMQRRPDDGLAWLAALEPHWNGKGAFLHHLWWHQAMFRPRGANSTRCSSSTTASSAILSSPLVAAMPDFYVDVQNAASMLLRLELRGVHTGERWEELADKAQARIGDCLSAWTLPHWMMALAASGREGFGARDARCSEGETSPVVREVAAPVPGDRAPAQRARRGAALMSPLAGRLQELGGSHAQRDVLAQLVADSSRRLQRAA